MQIWGENMLNFHENDGDDSKIIFLFLMKGDTEITTT